MTKPKPKSQVEAVAREIFELVQKSRTSPFYADFDELPKPYQDGHRLVARWHLRKIAALKLKRK